MREIITVNEAIVLNAIDGNVIPYFFSVYFMRHYKITLAYFDGKINKKIIHIKR